MDEDSAPKETTIEAIAAAFFVPQMAVDIGQYLAIMYGVSKAACTKPDWPAIGYAGIVYMACGALAYFGRMAPHIGHARSRRKSES